MRGTNLKRCLWDLALVVLYAGAVLFAVLRLHPVMAAADADMKRLEQAQDRLGRWLDMSILPTRQRIAAERDYTAGMRDEYGRLRSYYVRRDLAIEGNLLEAYTGDPARVKRNYAAFKDRLRAAARGSAGGTLLPAYDWESPGREPPREELDRIEKNACIAEAVVALFGPLRSCALTQIAIGGPVARPGPPVRAEAGVEALRYAVWPVTLQFSVPSGGLARVLDVVAAAPPGHPCFVLRSLEVASGSADRLDVTLGLGVLDFE
jgi:hypothetical protein